MTIFDLPQAQHFCVNYAVNLKTTANGLGLFFKNRGAGVIPLNEGATDFNLLRNAILSDAERSLYLSVSLYRRSLDLMTTSSASWAQVTLYYSSFYAASAILGMFGGASNVPEYVIEVAKGNLGHQTLKIHRDLSHTKNYFKKFTRYSGPHRAFWEIFYNSCSSLTVWIPDTNLHIALTPVSGNKVWQIDTRNRINYVSFEALDLCQDFERSFSDATFPGSLPGSLNTQHSVTEAMILTAVYFAKELKIGTDALNVLGTPTSRELKMQGSIQNAAVFNLTGRSRFAEMVS